MRKNVTKDRLIIISVLTLITGVFWISLEVYRSLVTDKITPEFKSEITPLNPRLDVQVLDQIVAKRSLNVDLQQPLQSQLNIQLTTPNLHSSQPTSSPAPTDIQPTPLPTKSNPVN